jgi:hypothetical protein
MWSLRVSELKFSSAVRGAWYTAHPVLLDLFILLVAEEHRGL